MERTGERKGMHNIERIHEQLDALERAFSELPDQALRARMIDHLLRLRVLCNRRYTTSEQREAQPSTESHE